MVGCRSPGRTGHSSAPAAEWLAVAVDGWWSWPASAAESWSWPPQWSSAAGWLWSGPRSRWRSRSRSPSRCGPVARPDRRCPRTRQAETRRHPAPSPGATTAACPVAVALAVALPSRPAVPAPSRRWAVSVRSAGPALPPGFMLPECAYSSIERSRARPVTRASYGPRGGRHTYVAKRGGARLRRDDPTQRNDRLLPLRTQRCQKRPVTCGFGARGGIRTLELPITSRMLGVGLDGSRRI